MGSFSIPAAAFAREVTFHPLGPTTFRASLHRVIKGPCDPPEVKAMQFVTSHTHIPIPRLFAVHVRKETGSILIEMAYIKGACLESAWNRLSTGERETVFADIKQHLSWLRELQPRAQDIVSSAYENPAYDCLIGDRLFGPMNEHESHSFISATVSTHERRRAIP